MARIYAEREDNGSHLLVALKCDRCGAEITPNPQITSSGWTKQGQYRGWFTDKFEWDYCERCS